MLWLSEVRGQRSEVRGRFYKFAVVLLFAVTALFADIEVLQKIQNSDSPTNNQVTPSIQITNNNSSTINLSDIVLEYFIYEPQLNVSTLLWRNDWCRIGSNNNAASAYTISFSRLDTAYTTGDKKADIKVTISFSQGYSLATGESAELKFAFYRNDWSYNFNEVVHWSWKNSNTYALADSTLFRSTEESCQAGECLIYGEAPPSSRVDGTVYPENCGAGENMKFDGTISSAHLTNKYELTAQKQIFSYATKSSVPGAIPTFASNSMASSGLSIKFSGRLQPMGKFYSKLTLLNAFSLETSKIKCDTALVSELLKAKEIKVTANGWSDFVFKKDYNLRTLSETENFIKENGHLPEIPSAVEVEKEGINVAEMQSKLLAKVEELTLYCIELEKKVKRLEDDKKGKN